MVPQPVHDDFAKNFRDIQQKCSYYYSLVLTDAGLGMQQYALLNLFQDQAPISMSEAAERLNLSKPAITHLVDRLEEMRCLKRVPHPSDRRVYLLEIQTKGKNIVEKIQTDIIRFLEARLREFSVPERKIIVDFYRLVAQNLDSFLESVRAQHVS